MSQQGNSEINKPANNKNKIAVCLSGGGYRAALFHLGALRRLNELGILGQVDTITSVSGGSILSAHLAACLKKQPFVDNKIPDWENLVAAPFRKFCKRDIRTIPVLKRFLLPWNWPRRSTQVNALMHRYERYLTGMKLIDLPDYPNFVYCATDIVYGINWVFERTRVGDYGARHIKTPADWETARAVAASSCFPPVFDPMPIGKLFVKESKRQQKKITDKENLLPKIRLSDGGVYDNLGMEPIKTHNVVFVSDGGAPFKVFTKGTAFRLWMRYFGITSNQIGALRKRWLFADFNTEIVKNGVVGPLRQGAYWGIASASTFDEKPDLPGYNESLADKVISQIRTDLDGFTNGEIAVLENHGYLLANRVIKKYLSQFYPESAPPPAIPHPEWMDDAKVRRELYDCKSRFSPRRILNKLIGRDI